MIPVKVHKLFLSDHGFVVVLKSCEDERSVPIFIGAGEAQAIAIKIHKVKVSRPLTHDLFKKFMDFLECRIKRIEVFDIRDGTYYGRLIVDHGGEEFEFDCRPSDGIALALRSMCPIFVKEKVLDEAGQIKDGVTPRNRDMIQEITDNKTIKQLSPLEILHEKLAKAVEEERYEDAARFRDEIDKLKKHTDN